MKCKHCGTRVGIFERWRYGDFCSEGHREDFAEDLNRLNAQIVKDLRRIPARLKIAVAEEQPEGREPEGLEPPQAWLVAEPDPGPVAMEPAREPRREVQAVRARNCEWKALAKIAEWDDLPVAVLAASRKRQLRSIWMEGGGAPWDGPASSLVAAAYPVFLPSPELRQFRVRMAMAGLTAAGSGSGPAAANSVRPAAMGTPAWIDDQGWRWIPESGPPAAPRMEAVLIEAPLRAPWANWEFVAPRRGVGRASRGMMPGYGVLPFMGEAYPAQAQPAWRLLAPPLFNALVDVAYGIVVSATTEEFAPAVVSAMTVVDEPLLPVLDEKPRCDLQLVDCQDDLSSDERMADRVRVMGRPLLNTLWRRQLNLPGMAKTAARLQVPRHPAPAIRLAIGAPPELPAPGGEMFATRRAH